MHLFQVALTVSFACAQTYDERESIRTAPSVMFSLARAGDLAASSALSQLIREESNESDVITVLQLLDGRDTWSLEAIEFAMTNRGRNIALSAAERLWSVFPSESIAVSLRVLNRESNVKVQLAERLAHSGNQTAPVLAILDNECAAFGVHSPKAPWGLIWLPIGDTPYFEVAYVCPNSIAQKSGLRNGDRVISVDGVAVTARRLITVLSELDTVSLVILRASQEEAVLLQR